MRGSDFLLPTPMPQITASHLCAYLRCPHRICRDAFDDPADKDPPNEFVQMLWEQGTQYEAEILEKMRGEREVLDLSALPVGSRAAATLDALSNRVPLIYHGRLQTDELLGEPDLLELLPDGEYRPVDIKSGMGLEGQDEDNEGSYKKGYAVQLALYTDALRQLGYATHCRGAIWDSLGQIVEYDLSLPRGKRTVEG
jgi:predicted RecB family nuclease